MFLKFYRKIKKYAFKLVVHMCTKGPQKVRVYVRKWVMVSVRVLGYGLWLGLALGF